MLTDNHWFLWGLHAPQAIEFGEPNVEIIQHVSNVVLSFLVSFLKPCGPCTFIIPHHYLDVLKPTNFDIERLPGMWRFHCAASIYRFSHM